MFSPRVIPIQLLKTDLIPVLMSILCGIMLAPNSAAQMLESQRIRTGQSYAGQSNTSQSNIGQPAGEPSAVRGAGHVTLPPQTGMNQAGVNADRTQAQSNSNVYPASYESQSSSINGNPSRLPADSPAFTPTSSTEIKLKEPSKGNEGRITKPTSQWATLFSVGFSLCIVVCLFLGVAWIAKKSMPAGSSRLPNEVVEVLGRSTIAPRQQVYVLRFGRKLLLVSQQPGQTQTLSEITDEEEVIRLAGICESNSPRSATRTFSDVLKHVATGKAEPPSRPQRRTA